MNDRPRGLATLTLAAFTRALGDKVAVPGGGAAAGSALAHGAGLGEMVISFSAGKKSLAQHAVLLEAAAEDLAVVRTRALELADEDAAAFEALAAGWTASPPPSAIDEIEAIRAAIAPPLELIEQARTGAEILHRLVGRSNPRLVSDLAIAAGFIALAVDAAMWNIEMNHDALRGHLEDLAAIDAEAADAENSIKAVRDLCELVATACRTDPRKTIVE